MGGCKACEEGRRAEEKRGGSRNKPGCWGHGPQAREGGARAGDVRPRCYRLRWVYQGPQKDWKKVKQSKNSAQIRLFDLADSYPKSSMRWEINTHTEKQPPSPSVFLWIVFNLSQSLVVQCVCPSLWNCFSLPANLLDRWKWGRRTDIKGPKGERGRGRGREEAVLLI